MGVIIFFIGGLVFGSFLNVLIYRLDRQEGLLTGRSECRNCKTQLKWLDLIPLASFIFLKRRCRYCKAKISYVYPSVELLTGVVFALFYLKLGIPYNMGLFYQLILVFLSISIIFFDYIYYIIPDKIVLPLICMSLILSLTVRRAELVNLLTSGLLFGGFFAILYIVSRGKWVGLGDAKLSLLIGLSLGYPAGFLVMVVSIWTAALVGLTLIIFKRASFKSELPLGLFLSSYLIILIIFQHEIQIFNRFFY